MWIMAIKNPNVQNCFKNNIIQTKTEIGSSEGKKEREKEKTLPHKLLAAAADEK
jgi:hypothetical protein